MLFFSIVNEYLTQAVQANVHTRKSEGREWVRADLTFLLQILEYQPQAQCVVHIGNTTLP